MAPDEQQGAAKTNTTTRGSKEDDGDGGPEPECRLVVVLTLARHADGIWITRLMSELGRRFPPGLDADGDDGGCVVRRRYRPVVVALEDLLHPAVRHGLGVDGIPDDWACLVNRVSDAAGPAEVKACLAVLRAAQLWGLPVFNGPAAYSIGCNKMLHHHVFARAGLSAPRSVLVRLGGGGGGGGGDNSDTTGAGTGTAADELSLASGLLEDAGATWPFLVKPNSAGFGAGIEMFDSPGDLAAYDRAIDAGWGGGGRAAPSNDGVALLQEYVEPMDGSVYRVWFLDGRVQCATRRGVVVGDGGPASAADRFTGGCAGGVCSLPRAEPPSPGATTPPGIDGRGGDEQSSSAEDRFRQRPDGTEGTRRVRAWPVPPEVEGEIGDILGVVGGDCHAGSVEFLLDSRNGDRVYFDLNMLSTLPIHDIDGSVDVSDGVWPESFNPWAQLADSVANMVLKSEVT